MLGWDATSRFESSTFCPACRKQLVPLLWHRTWLQSGEVSSGSCEYLSPMALRFRLERLLEAVAFDDHSVALSLTFLLHTAPELYINLQFYSARLGLPTVCLPLSSEDGTAVVPEIAIGWSEEAALESVAPMLPSWLPRDNPTIAASLIPAPDSLSLVSLVNVNDPVIKRMQAALIRSDFNEAAQLFLRARGDAPAAHPLYSRSLYIVCLVLSVKLSLFGFQEVPVPTWTVPSSSSQMLTAGTGALEHGMERALMDVAHGAGSNRDLDALVMPQDWPSVSEALSFRGLLGFVFQ